MKFEIVLTSILVLIVSFSCKNNSSDSSAAMSITALATPCKVTDSTATWASVQSATSSCATTGCHDVSGNKAMLNMTDKASAVLKVIPGNSTGSLLYTTLVAGKMTDSAKTNGNPYNAAKPEAVAIKKWIDAGCAQ